MGGGKTTTVNEGTFLIGGWGVGRGFGGGSLVNFLQIGQGQTCFNRNRGRVTVLSLARKNYSMSLLFVKKHTKCIEISKLYMQAKLPVETNLNYLQVSKYYIKKLSCPTNIIVSLDPYPLSSKF